MAFESSYTCTNRGGGRGRGVGGMGTKYCSKPLHVCGSVFKCTGMYPQWEASVWLVLQGAVDQRIKQEHAAWKLLHTGLHFVLTLIPYSTYDTECIEFQKFSVKYLKQMFPTQYYLWSDVINPIILRLCTGMEINTSTSPYNQNLYTDTALIWKPNEWLFSQQGSFLLCWPSSRG